MLYPVFAGRVCEKKMKLLTFKKKNSDIWLKI